MTGSLGAVLALFTAGGVGVLLSELIRALLGRKRGRIDAAAVIQAAAVDLVQPLHKELENVRTELHQAKAEIRSWVAWSRECRHRMDQAGVAIPPVPEFAAGDTTRA